MNVDASSLPGAIVGAKIEFGKGLDRKQWFDLNKNGLEIKILCVVTPAPTCLRTHLSRKNHSLRYSCVQAISLAPSESFNSENLDPRITT